MNFSSKLKESMRFSAQGFALLASRLWRVFRAFSDGLLANPRAFPHEGSHLQQEEYMFIYLHRSSISPMKHSASSVFSMPLLALCATWLELCLHPALLRAIRGWVRDIFVPRMQESLGLYISNQLIHMLLCKVDEIHAILAAA